MASPEQTPEQLSNERTQSTASRRLRTLALAGLLAVTPAGEEGSATDTAGPPTEPTAELALRSLPEHEPGENAAERSAFVALVLRHIAETRKTYGLFPDFDDRAKGILRDHAPMLNELTQKYDALSEGSAERKSIEALAEKITDKIFGDIEELAKSLGGGVPQDDATAREKTESGIPQVGQKMT